MKSPLARENQTWKIAASARSSSDRDGCVLLDTEKGMFYGASTNQRATSRAKCLQSRHPFLARPVQVPAHIYVVVIPAIRS